MILVGLLGVIKCGDPIADQPLATTMSLPLTSAKQIGDPKNTPTQMMYNVICMSWLPEIDDLHIYGVIILIIS